MSQPNPSKGPLPVCCLISLLAGYVTLAVQISRLAAPPAHKLAPTRSSSVPPKPVARPTVARTDARSPTSASSKASSRASLAGSTYRYR